MKITKLLVLLATASIAVSACGGQSTSSSSSVRTKNAALATLPPKLQTQNNPEDTTTVAPPTTQMQLTPTPPSVPATTMAPGACTISASFREVTWCKPAQSWTYAETSGANVGTKKSGKASVASGVLGTSIAVSAYATGVLVSIRFVDGTTVSGVKIAFKTSAYPVPQ